MVVDVLETIFFGGSDKSFSVAQVKKIVIVLQVHIGLGSLGDDQLAGTGVGVRVEEIELVLQSVKSEKSQGIGIFCPVDSRQVTVRVGSGVYFLGFGGSQIIHMNADAGVFLSCFWVLKLVIFGI